jgi:hypothetical protein
MQDGHAAFVVHASITAFLESEKQRESFIQPLPTAHHPIVEIYRGTRPVPIVEAQGQQISQLTIVPLHLALLPPASSFETEEERVADAYQVEMTSRNWHMLLTTLLPTFYSFPGCDRPLTYSAWLALRSDAGLMDRMHYSYGVALHFYGWRLHDQETGTVDRHKNWRVRYDALQDDEVRYAYITWLLRHLLEFMLTSYAHRLTLFLVEEFAAGRLLQLREMWRRWWWPMINGCTEVDALAKLQLRRREAKLDQSDSD